MDVLEWAKVVIPTITGLSVALMGLAAAARTRRIEAIELSQERTRKQAHELRNIVHNLPATLRLSFVERGEWVQAQKAGDDIHADHARRIGALENAPPVEWRPR